MFELLLEVAVTLQEMTSRYLVRPEVTRKWRHFTVSHLEVAVEAWKLNFVYIWAPTRLQLAGGSPVAGNYVTWTGATGSDPQVTYHPRSPGSGCRRPKTWVLCTFELLQGCNSRRWQSRDRKWCNVTWSDRKWPWIAVISVEVIGSGCKRPKTGILCTFELLQGSNSQEVALTWREMTSCYFAWLEVTRSDVISPEVPWKRL